MRRWVVHKLSLSLPGLGCSLSNPRLGFSCTQGPKLSLSPTATRSPFGSERLTCPPTLQPWPVLRLTRSSCLCGGHWFARRRADEADRGTSAESCRPSSPRRRIQVGERLGQGSCRREERCHQSVRPLPALLRGGMTGPRRPAKLMAARWRSCRAGPGREGSRPRPCPPGQ